MIHRPGLFLLLGWLALALRAAPRDLDVGVPPGSPLEWSASLPAYTPPRGPLFPRTGEKEKDGEQRSSAKLATSDVEVRISNAFGQVRILTWDLGLHLEWIKKPLPVPRTGRSSLRPPDPVYGEPLYWLSLAPLLRLLLHPAAFSRSELLAHVVEIGEPALPVLGAASAERDLAPACRELRALIRVDQGPIPSAPGGGTPRETAFARFVLEECLRDQPTDPTDDFGRRMFLFPVEAEPLLRAYAEHPSLELARNAVSALSRYETRSSVAFLAALAARVEDPVTLVRALAGIGRYQGPLDVAPLVARLKRTTEPVQRSALIGALGRLRAREAAPLLLELGETARKDRDADLLLSVLSALARIAWTQPRPEISAFCQRVAADTRTANWSVPRGMSADIPDAPSLREKTLRQLADLVHSQADPLDEGARKAILEMAEAAPVDPRLSERGVGGSDPIGSLAPTVRMLYLEGLLRAGPAGLERLASLARRPELETALRGKAIALLPYDQRTAIAKAMVVDELQPVELRVQALEMLISDQHPEVDALCRAQLDRAALDAPRPPAGELYLTMRAVRALSEAGRLKAAQLAPLFGFVQRPLALRETQLDEVRGYLGELLDAAASGERERALGERAGKAFDAMLAHGLNPLLGPDDRDALVGQLVKASRRGDDEETREAGVQRLLAILVSGEAFLVDPSRKLFEAAVPLAEEVLLALGRTHEAPALELLLTTLKGEARDLRAHAALALGMCGVASVARELLPALLDEDPFVRFCASESLRHLTGKELAVNWMSAPAAERVAAAEEFRRWFLEEKR